MDNTSKNMQELLKFAIQQQQNEKSESIEIDEDKKNFLDEVLQSMSVNIKEEFLKAICILQNESKSDEEKLDALDIIREYIDDMDFANSFVKIEGAEILINCFKHTNKDIRISAISIVAEMSQNNPLCQQYFLKCDIMEQLIKLLSCEDLEVIASALYALSSLIRNYEPGIIEFIKKDGIKHAKNCLNVESSRVFSKACFLITSISSEFCLVKDEFARLGTYSELIKKLRIVTYYDNDIEMTLRTMSVLITSRYCTTNEDENKKVTDILKSIVIKNKNHVECEEIVAYSDSILRDMESREETND